MAATTRALRLQDCAVAATKWTLNFAALQTYAWQQQPHVCTALQKQETVLQRQNQLCCSRKLSHVSSAKPVANLQSCQRNRQHQNIKSALLRLRFVGTEERGQHQERKKEEGEEKQRALRCKSWLWACLQQPMCVYTALQSYTLQREIFFLSLSTATTLELWQPPPVTRYASPFITTLSGTPLLYLFAFPLNTHNAISRFCGGGAEVPIYISSLEPINSAFTQQRAA